MSNREKAWTAEQESARQYTAEELESHCGKLWDSQWTSVVNHDNCYAGWDKDDAINHAVKLTEQYIRKNFDAYAATLRQQGEKAAGLVSDEIRDSVAKIIADRIGNGMREKYHPQADAIIEAVAPILRAPVEHARLAEQVLSRIVSSGAISEDGTIYAELKRFIAQNAPVGQGGRVDEARVQEMCDMYDTRLPKDWDTPAACPEAMRAALAQNAQPCDGQACVHCDPEHGCKPAQNVQGEIGVGVDVTDEGTHVCVRQGKTIVYSRMHHAEHARVQDGMVLVDREVIENADVALSMSKMDGEHWTQHESPRFELRKALGLPYEKAAIPSQPEDAA